MHPDEQAPSTSRRAFLQQATGLAACIGATVPAAAAADTSTSKAEPLLPTIHYEFHPITSELNQP